jgi:hypothetical protein
VRFPASVSLESAFLASCLETLGKHEKAENSRDKHKNRKIKAFFLRLLCLFAAISGLSNSTESRDRGEKAEDYFRLKSLRDYVVIAQNRARVEHFSRQDDGKWLFEVLENLADVLVLSSIGCQIPLQGIYARVNLKPQKLVKKRKQK